MAEKYIWQNLSKKEKLALLNQRKINHLPWHSPPHFDVGRTFYHITASCYLHRPIIGHSYDRMLKFENELINILLGVKNNLVAWCILPNHYHILIETKSIKGSIRLLGQLHGRTSYMWNGEEDSRGRKVWYNCMDRAMRSERHFWVTINYIHNNPVHHHHCNKWQDWPYSSSRLFLENFGRRQMTKIWNDYPILDYGKRWDEPDL